MDAAFKTADLRFSSMDAAFKNSRLWNLVDAAVKLKKW